MDILILFLEQRNQQCSRQWVAFGLFYIYRIRIANTYAQILMLNFIHLNNVLRHKRNAGTPNTRGALSYYHLSSSESCFIQDILYAKCRSFLAVLICVFSAIDKVQEVKPPISFPQILFWQRSVGHEAWISCLQY